LPLMLTQVRLSLLPRVDHRRIPYLGMYHTPQDLGARFGRFARSKNQVGEGLKPSPLLDDGLGQDPEASHRVQDHEDEHRQLAPQSASRVTK
jgi:hypothetical protein